MTVPTCGCFVCIRVACSQQRRPCCVTRRLLVETSKSTAAEQHLSHVGRAVGQQTGISTYHWKTEWAAATRSIKECKMRIERIGGSRLDTDSEVWGLDQTTWELTQWAGEAAMRKGIPARRQAGYESISDLPRIQQSYREKASVVIPPVMRICATSNGKQRVQMLNPVVQ